MRCQVGTEDGGGGFLSELDLVDPGAVLPDAPLLSHQFS